MAAYYSQWAHKNIAQRSQQQWYSYKFCNAVKHNQINGTLTFPWQAGAEVIGPSTVSRCRTIFGLFIKHTIEKQNWPQPVILVPVPSKDGLLTAQNFRSLQMTLDSIKEHGNWSVAPILRFSEALIPAHQGGPRGREAIKPYLRVISAPPQGSLILIDDLITSGGSLLASYDVLAGIGRAPLAAIVCGHTVSDSLLSAFGDHQKSIDTAPQVIDF